MSHEKIPFVSKSAESKESLLKTPSPEEKREALRSSIFQQLVAREILDGFHQEMEDAGLTQNEIEAVSNSFYSLSEKSKEAVLAIPFELRPRVFRRYAELIHSGKMSCSEVVFDLLSKAHSNGYTLGFHLSPVEIKPAKDGSWVIKGTEKDHRHNDLPMAYYSFDYEHRYQKKPMNYLYAIRAEQKLDSGHYQDNDGSWGHAPTLSVVQMVELNELEQEMERQIKALEKIQKGEDSMNASSPSS